MSKFKYTLGVEDAIILHNIAHLITTGARLEERYPTMLRLGSGCFSVVYEHPTNPRLCIKVGKAETDPWLAYATYAYKRVSDINLLGIYALHVHPTFYIAVVERLSEAPNNLAAYARSRSMQDAAKGYEWLIHMDHESVAYSTYTRWVRLFNKMRKLAPEANMDMHSGNVMFRGNVPVITDPLAWGYTRAKAIKAVEPLVNGVSIIVNKGA